MIKQVGFDYGKLGFNDQNRDLTMKNGDLMIITRDLTLGNGDVVIKTGDLTMGHGDLVIMHWI